MSKFLNNISLEAGNDIQFKTTAGSNAGKIEQVGDNLVLSNAIGDVLLGDGASDVYIGDGTNNVDIVFEQSGSIRGDGSAITLTLGGSNTTLNLENPNINGTLSLTDKLAITTSNSYILFDYEPTTAAGEYASEVPLLKVDRSGSELTILSRLTNNGAVALGNDDTVAIIAGDTKGAIKDNINYAGENVILASESGFTAYGFPSNDTTWTNRNEFRFRSDSGTASDNGLYIGDGGSTQFIDLSRNLKNIGTISAGAITSSGSVTATSFVKSGGTTNQFLKANGNVDGTAYAPLASPALTGTPTAPTAAANTNTTQIATTAYVQTELSDLIGGAPTALDTLNELAAAINDDSAFSSTVTTALGNRLRIDINNQGLTSTQQGYGRTNLGLGTAATSASTAFATAAQGTSAETAYNWGNHASAGYLTGNQTITLSGDVSGSGTTSISVSLANDSVGAAEIAANAVGASELNVSGNGTTAQFLRSDGDGTFTWATPTDTNTTYSAGNGISLSGTTFSVAAGGGLTQDASGLSHSDTSSQASVDNSNGTVIQDITLDTYGHITAIGSANLDSRYFTETESDARFLGITAKAADSNLLDGIDSSAFLRSNAADSLTNVLTVDDANGGTIVYNLASEGVYIPKPQGADYVTTSSTQTGAIGIKLPTTAWGSADMISFHVDIYDYAGDTAGESVTLHIFGYQYQTESGNPWLNVGASVQSDRTDRDYTVRFGNDGTRAIVWIGETNSTWAYHQIVVRDFVAGYNAQEANWDTGWDIVADVTSFGTVNKTATANYPVAKQLKTARNIALTGAVTGNANFDGSGNISIATTATADPTLTLAGDASGSATFTNLGNATLTVTVADDSHNHIISNVDGLQTALDAKQAAGTYNTIIGTDTDISYSGATVLSAMTMTDGVIQSHSSRTLTLADLGYTGATNANNYSLPEATSTVRGGIELFSDTDQSVAANAVSSTAGRTYGIQLNSAGQAVVNVPWTDNNTTYSAGTGLTLDGTSFSATEATSSTRGAIKLFSNTDQSVAANAVSTTAGRTYGIQLNSSGQAVVNVPWVDTNTTYNLGSFGITATAGELNTLDGITATTTELNYTDGVTSNIQTQLNARLADSSNGTISGARNFTGTFSLGGTTITATAAELNYTDGVTSNIQTQLNGKQASGTYNTIIGTDSDINTSGSTIIDNIFVTDGVITSMGTRTLTASDISALTQSTYEDIHWKQTGRIFTPQCTPLFYNSSGTAGTLAAVCFSRTEVTTTANAWAQACLNRTITNEISWSGGGIEFAREIGVSFKCGFLASGTTAQSIRYMVGGRANNVQAAGSDPLVSRGFGVEIRSRTGTTLEWRVIAHNGTSFTGGTWSDIPSNATSVYTKELYIYSDGSGNIEAGIDDRGGDGSSWTTKSITGGPTANGNSTYPYICHEVVNAASGSSYARARVYDYKVFSE